MNKTNNRLKYSDEDLKILKKTIKAVKKLNWNKNNYENKEKVSIQRKAA
mgnify:CR=1 FL=1